MIGAGGFIRGGDWQPFGFERQFYRGEMVRIKERGLNGRIKSRRRGREKFGGHRRGQRLRSLGDVSLHDAHLLPLQRAAQ